MHYEKLIEVHKSLVSKVKQEPRRKKEDEAYKRGLKIKWDEIFSNDREIESLFEFLNVWGRCHVEHERKKLREHFQRAFLYVKELRDLPWTFDLKTLREVDNEKLTVQRIVQIAFDMLAHGGPERFGHVAASKVLHAYSPNLLTPWDGRILHELREKDKDTVPDLRADGYLYAFKFLPYMKRQGKEAIKSYIESCKDQYKAEVVDAATAIIGIESLAEKEGEPATFAKLLDEYNWAVPAKGGHHMRHK